MQYDAILVTRRARATVERATGNSSACSALCACRRAGVSRSGLPAQALALGPLTTQPPFALATFMPSLVRILIKSDSNSAIIPRMLYSSRPDRIGRIGQRAADLEPRRSLGEFLDDVAGVGQRTSIARPSACRRPAILQGARGGVPLTM